MFVQGREKLGARQTNVDPTTAVVETKQTEDSLQLGLRIIIEYTRIVV